MPLHTSYGFDFGLLVALANGTTLFLEDEVSPKRIAKLLREQNIDFFAGNPALYGSLVRVPTIKPLKTTGARFLSSRLGAARRASPRASTSGSASACSPATTARRRGRWRSIARGKDPETVGRAFEGVEVRVAGAKGDRLPAGEIGPILGALEDAVAAGRCRRSTCPSATTASRSAASARTAGSAPATSDSSTRTGA